MASIRTFIQKFTKNHYFLSKPNLGYFRYQNVRLFSTENQKEKEEPPKKVESASYEYAKKDFLSYDSIIQQKEKTSKKSSPFRTILWLSSLGITAWASYDFTIAFLNYRLGEQSDEEKKFDLWKKYGTDVLSQVLASKSLKDSLGTSISLSNLRIIESTNDYTTLMIDNVKVKDSHAIRAKLFAYVSNCVLHAKLTGPKGSGDLLLYAVTYNGTWAMKQVLILKDKKTILAIPEKVVADPIGVPYYSIGKELAGDKINDALKTQKGNK